MSTAAIATQSGVEGRSPTQMAWQRLKKIALLKSLVQ